MPVGFQPIDTLAAQDHQSAFHHRRLDHGRRSAGRAGEYVHRHVKCRMDRQERLESRVVVTAERQAFDFALVAGEARRSSQAGQGLIFLLKYQEAGGRGAAGNLHILAGGKIGVAAAFQAMLPRLEQDARGAFQHVNEILVRAGITCALALPLHRDEQLGEPGALLQVAGEAGQPGVPLPHLGELDLRAGQVRGRGDHVEARQVAGHKTARCKQRIAPFDNVACGAE